MSIALNISKVKSETLPYLSKSKTSITDAYGKCNSLKNSLPTNFSYRNYLNSLSNQLYTLRQDITNVEKLINDKLSKVNSIEKKADSRTDQLKSLASKLAASATLNMHIGPATVSVNKSTMNYIEKGFEQTQNFLDKIGAIISSGVSSIAEKNVTDYKGANVDVKKDWDSFFSSAANKVNDVLEWNSKTSDKIDRWFEQRIEDTGAILGEVVSYIAENVPRVLANFTNELLGFTKGVGRLAEGVVDGLVGIGTVLTSIPTVAIDVFDGVVTNDWSFERVSSIWEWTQSFVSTEYVNGWYNSYYEGYGKILNQYADDVFDSTGAATQVLDQVGYFGGAIASGQWIAGAGSAVLGCEMTTATSTGLFSFVGGLGRNSEQAWNDGASTLEGMLYGTVRGIYEGLQTSLGVKINLFKPFGESGFLSQIGNTLTHVMADTVDGGSGAIFDPLFKMIYSPNQKNQEVIMQSINYNEKGEKINDVKWEDLSFGEKYGLLFEYSGGWDTVKTQAIAGGVLSLLSEIPDIGGAFKNTKASQTSIPKQASKAELETELSKIDNMIEANKTEWHELYQKTKTHEYKKAIENFENGYAGSLSDMDDAIFIKNRMESLESEMEGLIKNKQSIEKSLDEVIEQSIKTIETDNISSTKNVEVENSQNSYINTIKKYDSAKTIEGEIEAAQIFNDSKQYLFQKLKYLSEQYKGTDDTYLKKLEQITHDERTIGLPTKGRRPVAEMDEQDLFDFLNSKGALTDYDYNLINMMKNNSVNYTAEEMDAIFVYTAWYGPQHAAYLRNTDTKFGGKVVRGDSVSTQNNLNTCIETYNTKFNKNMKKYTVDEFNSIMDQIMGKNVLQEDTILYRSADSIFFEGGQIEHMKIKPGTIINDEAFTSTSVVPTNISQKNKYLIEIYAPAGTKGAYLETVTGVSRYNQQEFLLPRNSSYKIVGYPEEIIINGEIKYKLKVELLPQTEIKPEINVLKQSISNEPKEVSNYAKTYGISSGITGDELIAKMKQNNLYNRYNNEVSDMHSKKLYDNVTFWEHNYEHVENVLLNSMYMGKELGLSDSEMEILIDCAKYHDTGLNGRGNNHKGHGAFSSQIAGNDLKNKYSSSDIAKIKSIIEYHELNDESQFKILCNRNGIYDSIEIDNIKKIGDILKDADAIDRTRFPGNLNVKYLRNKEVANDLVLASYDLRDKAALNEYMSSIEKIKQKINNNDISSVEKNKLQKEYEELWNLYNSEKYPDYILNFARKYYRGFEFSSVTEHADYILETHRFRKVVV